MSVRHKSFLNIIIIDAGLNPAGNQFSLSSVIIWVRDTESSERLLLVTDVLTISEYYSHDLQSQDD